MSNTGRRKLQTTAWVIPSLYAGGTIVFGMLLPRMDHHFWPQLATSMSPSAGMAIYSAIASGMIALTGIVFSLTFLMVQFSATAYSPRLVLWIARDPVISHALGVFTATFLYAVTAISGVDRSGSGKVPMVSVAVVLGLLLASVALFVALIQRIGLLQINRMLVFTGDQGRAVIERLPEHVSQTNPASELDAVRGRQPAQTLIYHGRPRAIQSVDVTELVGAAQRCGGIIEMRAAVGDTLVESTPVLQIFASDRAVDERELLHALELGEERTFEQDPK